MKIKSLLVAAFLVVATPTLSFANSLTPITSGTNRLLIEVVKDSPELVTSMPAFYFAPVYRLRLTNYAPKGGPSAVIKAMDFGYRSSDVKRDELSAVSIYEITPKYTAIDYLNLSPGDQYFESFMQYSGDLVIQANDSVDLLFYAVSNSSTNGATQGDKFQFYVKDISIGEVGTGAIIKSDPIGKQSGWITIH